MTGWQRFKLVFNFVNLMTLAGFAVATIGRARISRGPRGLFFASGYRLSFPIAGAFTIGNVILTPHAVGYLDSEQLVRHEERHSWQYLCLLGFPFWPLYGVCAGWSWLRTGDFASRNLFERMAGLVDGGYIEHQPRSLLKAIRAGRRSHPPVL